MRLLSLTIGLLLAPQTRNADPPALPLSTELQKAQNLIQPADPGKFQIGKVTFDLRKREVSFPAQVNLRDALIEYAVVGKTGKRHESLLMTEADPVHIHLAMLLLGAKIPPPKSKDKVPSPGQAINILISWQKDGKEQTGRLEDWIIVGEDKLPAGKGKWIYNGARIENGHFTAAADQSVVALILDIHALVNNPRTGNENDEIWFPHEIKIPPLGTKVQVTFQLEKLEKEKLEKR